MSMEIVLRVPGCAPANETAAFLKRVEAAGFDGVGIPDTQLIMRDVYVTLALAAQQTSHITLFTAVTNPTTRHVSVLASLIQTVEELAPGRLKIMVGSGYSAVRTIGQPKATLKQMREGVETVRRILSGETVSLNGFEARLPYASGRHIPIIIAASGPRTIELAGEVADGVLISVGLHPAAMDAARRMFETGARKAGRDPNSLEVAYAGRVQVEKDMETALAVVRPMCAHWVMEPHRRPWLKEAGIEVSDLEIPEELMNLYPDLPHAENWEEAMRLTSFLSDEMVAQISEFLGIVGTTDHLTRRLQELEDYGVERLHVQTAESYSFPESTLRAFRDEVFPRMRA